MAVLQCSHHGGMNQVREGAELTNNTKGKQKFSHAPANGNNMINNLGKEVAICKKLEIMWTHVSIVSCILVKSTSVLFSCVVVPFFYL
jgi:hypothetical protein